MNVTAANPITLIFSDVDLTSYLSLPIIAANPGKNVCVLADPFIKIISAVGPGLGSVDINIGNNSGASNNLATVTVNNTNLYLINNALALTRSLQVIDISTSDVVLKINPNFVIPYTSLKATIVFQYYYF